MDTSDSISLGTQKHSVKVQVVVATCGKSTLRGNRRSRFTVVKINLANRLFTEKRRGY